MAEVVISIGGKKHWLWRAVDQDGFVLDVLVQSRRDTRAAKRLMRKLLKGQGQAPRVMITDKLRFYGAAKRDIMPGVEHRFHIGLNNRSENSHQPTRRRERIKKGTFVLQRPPKPLDEDIVEEPALASLFAPFQHHWVQRP